LLRVWVAATTTTQAHKAVRWVDEPVSFRAAGMEVCATFRHPVGEKSLVPAVLAIAGSGPTDRNGNGASESATNYTKSLPFSPVLKKAIRAFLVRSL
jgi:hypothetical protein